MGRHKPMSSRSFWYLKKPSVPCFVVVFSTNTRENVRNDRNLSIASALFLSCSRQSMHPFWKPLTLIYEQRPTVRLWGKIRFCVAKGAQNDEELNAFQTPLQTMRKKKSRNKAISLHWPQWKGVSFAIFHCKRIASALFNNNYISNFVQQGWKAIFELCYQLAIPSRDRVILSSMIVRLGVDTKRLWSRTKTDAEKCWNANVRLSFGELSSSD